MKLRIGTTKEMSKAERKVIDKHNHGQRLLMFFSSAKNKYPIILYKKIFRLETQGNALLLKEANEKIDDLEAHQLKIDSIVKKANELLSTDRIYPGVVPGGYFLKINLTEKELEKNVLTTDLGRDGVIAPTFDGTW